jgi:hypothetical protein
MPTKHEQFPLNQTPRYYSSTRPLFAEHQRRLVALAIALLLPSYCSGAGASINGIAPPPSRPRSIQPPPSPPPIGNQLPIALAACSTTPQSGTLSGFLRANDRDNSPNELTFSLNTSVPNIMGPVKTAKGTVRLLDVTTGEFIYTPNRLGPRGVDTFQFRVDDPDSFVIGTETVVINPAIMPLGDSITDGAFDDRQPPRDARVGYRRKLYNDLAAVGFNIDFVGSLQGGQSANPPITDPDHEGHDGRTANLIAQNVRLWLTLNPADIVLLHIGTNNINFDNPASTFADINQILDKIDRWELKNNTPVTVFLAEIIERTTLDGQTCDGCNANVASLNAGIRAIPGSRPDDDVVIVNQHDALDYSCNDGSCDMSPQQGGPSDNIVYIHPNQTGYNKMATTWLSELLASDKLAKCE